MHLIVTPRHAAHAQHATVALRAPGSTPDADVAHVFTQNVWFGIQRMGSRMHARARAGLDTAVIPYNDHHRHCCTFTAPALGQGPWRLCPNEPARSWHSRQACHGHIAQRNATRAHISLRSKSSAPAILSLSALSLSASSTKGRVKRNNTSLQYKYPHTRMHAWQVPGPKSRSGMYNAGRSGGAPGGGRQAALCGAARPAPPPPTAYTCTCK